MCKTFKYTAYADDLKLYLAVPNKQDYLNLQGLDNK